jgi:hypothetical protein
MTADELRRLLVAPEMVMVDLLLAALDALRLALVAEHPLLDDDLAALDDYPVRSAARKALRHADHLRRALRRYRKAVNTVLSATDLPADPF